MCLSKNEIKFLIVLCALSSVFYVLFFPGNSFYTDQSDYLVLGKEILQGEYSGGIFSRAPALPFLVAVFYLTGFSVAGVLFFLPLLLLNISLIVTFFFGKKILDNGYIPSLILVSLPHFWRWGVHLLTEPLLLIFSTLSILFFYLAVKKDSKLFVYSALFFALGFLTKVSIVIFVPFFVLYLILVKKLNLIKNKNFLIGALVFVIISTAVSCLIYLLSGTLDFNHLFVANTTRGVSFLFYFIRFGVISWSLFALIGILICLKKRVDKNIFVLTSFLVVFLAFQLMAYKEMRYIFMIFPLCALLATIGFEAVKGHSKKIAHTLLVLFFVFSMICSAWMLNFDSNHHLDRIPAGEYVLGLPKNVTIASEVSPYYLSLFHPNVIEFPGIELESGEIKQTAKEWVISNNADYVILSIYAEYNRYPEHYYYYPEFFLGLKVPLKLEYRSNRIPPGTVFKSAVYTQLETWDGFEKIYEDYQNGERIFMVYRVNKT